MYKQIVKVVGSIRRFRNNTTSNCIFLFLISESLVRGAVAPASRHSVLEEDARRLRDTISRFVILRVDHTEFACLKALVLFKAGTSWQHLKVCVGIDIKSPPHTHTHSYMCTQHFTSLSVRTISAAGHVLAACLSSSHSILFSVLNYTRNCYFRVYVVVIER